MHISCPNATLLDRLDTYKAIKQGYGLNVLQPLQSSGL